MRSSSPIHYIIGRMKRVDPLLIATSLLILTTSLLFFYLIFLRLYDGTYFPGVSVAGQHLDRQTPIAARQQLTDQFNQRINQPLILSFENQQQNLDLKMAGPEITLNQMLDSAYLVGRSGNIINDLGEQTQALFLGINFTPLVSYKSPSFLNSQISLINQSVKTDPVDAELVFGQKIEVTPSQNGQEADSDKLQQQINNYLVSQSAAPSTIPTRISYPNIDTQSAKNAAEALTKVKDKPIVLRFEDQKWTINESVLYNLLDLKGSNSNLATLNTGGTSFQIQELSIGGQNIKSSTIAFDSEQIERYLQLIADQLDRPAQDARFDFDGNRVQQFQPSEEGREVNQAKTLALIVNALKVPQSADINLPVEITQPTISAGSLNDFGIEKLVGTGVSHFAGSIPNRIYNLSLASSRIHGVLIAPGEVFSWNKTVGDISAATGYKQAYVIKSGRTVLDDGGGVCQVSTTLFRAILNSGLPVVERTAHAYRVGYYEQSSAPGLDATIFHPTVDFKFKNDTGNYLLIQAAVNGTTLVVDIYGKPDGRQVSLTAPVISNVTPAPPELRQDDPALPKGTVKQVDFAANGANINFRRTVTMPGQEAVTEVFRSNYRPWQAVFLVGTQ